MPLPTRTLNCGLWVFLQAAPGLTNAPAPVGALCPSGELAPAYDCALCGLSVTMGVPIAAGAITITIKDETSGTVLHSVTLVAGGPNAQAWDLDPAIDIGTGHILKCYVSTTANFIAGLSSVAITPIFSF